jgi:site-specific DNA-methyltransferase (adenine-specific)
MLELNQVHKGDCLELMPLIPDKSVDMILCDLPYGITACEWDSVIPFEPLWEQYKRVIKDRGAVVLTASQPFTTDLICSNRAWFKYCWVWDKKLAGNGIQAGNQPLKIHEDVVVFGQKIDFKEVITKGKRRIKNGVKDRHGLYGNAESKKVVNDVYHAKSIIEFSIAGDRLIRTHPTQKPVALFAYLIRTYTDEGDTVLDNCIGSGTTAVAALNTGRNFIGIEQSAEYVEIARKRIDRETRQERLAL